MDDAVDVLRREFPEFGRDAIERVLLDHDMNIATARSALLALTSPSGSRGQLDHDPRDEEEGGGDSWLSWLGLGSSSPSSKNWQLGLDDLQAGLGKVGAHMALGLRQAAHTVSQYIPDDLNPFVEEEEYIYEEGEEEEDRDTRRERDKAATKVVTASNNAALAKRGHQVTTPNVTLESPRALSDGDELSPKVAKKWD